MRRAPRAYRILLHLFPSVFRRGFGADMEHLFLDRLNELQDRPWARARLWVEAVTDVIANAAREWAGVAKSMCKQLMREGTGMDGLTQDIRFGIRTLMRRPGFTVAAVLTLALGIGANVSIFSVVNGVLLRPLPYPEPDALVVLWTVDQVRVDRSRTVDHPDVRTLQVQVPELSLAGFAGTRPTLTGFGDPEVLLGVRVTDGIIDLMGLEPVLGRDLRATDDVEGGPRVTVISHAFWVDRLARDPDVLGETITLNGEEWEIVGVAPVGFDYPNASQLWLPRRHAVEGCGHGCRIMNAVGRITPGVTIEQVQAQLDAVSQRIAEEFPNAHRDEGFAVESMLGSQVASVRTALWVLLGAVGMVLLIACANVANLMIVRATARSGEIALRATLGASRLRIVRQLLTESALLALAAGVVGVLLSYWGTAALTALAPDSLPRLDQASIDLTVLGYAALLVAAVTALFGVLPALQVSRGSLQAGMGGGRRSTGHPHGTSSRSILLVVEVALSLTLLLGSGLLVRTLVEIRAVDLGFDTESIERFRISVPEARYDSLQINAFLEQMENEFAAIPGVRSAGWGFGVPLASGNISTIVSLLDRPELAPPDRPSMHLRPSSSGFLDATGLKLLRGRWFDANDQYGSAGVAVINEAAVRAHYGDEDPIGRRIRSGSSWSFEEAPLLTIVGVVGDVVKSSPTDPPEPALYIANAQFAANTGYVSLRIEPGMPSAIPEARRVLRRLDPSLAIQNVTTMEDVVSRSHASTTFYLILLTAFSLLALVLAAVGLYGVVAYAVSQRTREIGIRIALGAASDEVVSMILRQAIRPAILGIVLGIATSWFSAKALASMLYGVTPQDPITLVSVTAMLLVVVTVATVLPARHASRVPPASALRSE